MVLRERERESPRGIRGGGIGIREENKIYIFNGLIYVSGKKGICLF